MGMIADLFAARIEEMRRRDEQSLKDLRQTLDNLKQIARDMERIEQEIDCN